MLVDFSEQISQHRSVLDRLVELEPAFNRVVACVIKTLENGGKIVLCGNGGSAADAQHIAAELVGRFKQERRALPAIALTTDSSIITAVGNDYGYEEVFARQVAALATEHDLLWVLSTSGHSVNITKALEVARKVACTTVGFLGKSGGSALALCDVALVVPSEDTARIQEMHMLLYHAVCAAVDKYAIQSQSLQHECA